MNLRLLAALLALSFAELAFASVTVFFKQGFTCTGIPATTQQVTVQAVDDKYRLQFHQSQSYCIQADSGDVIEWIRADPGVFARISTPPAFPIAVVESIGQSGTGSGGLIVDDLTISARLGPSVPTSDTLVYLLDCGFLRGPSAQLNSAISIAADDQLAAFIDFPSAVLKADIRRPLGRIASIVVMAIEGAANDPVDIIAKRLDSLIIGVSDDNGDTITVGDAKHVNVGDRNVPPADRTMELGGIKCSRDFIGDVWVRSLLNRNLGAGVSGAISTGRDLRGIFAFSQGFAGPSNDYSCDVAVRVGRTFSEASVIRLPMPGSGTVPPMPRTIVINGSRRVSFDAGGQWLGRIGFGRHPDTGELLRELTPESNNQYADHSREFGFGAVGVPPFGTYGADSYIAFLEQNATSVYQRSVLTEMYVNQPVTRAFKNIPEHLYARVRLYGDILLPSSFDQFGYIEYRTRNLAGTGCWTRLCIQTTGYKVGCRQFLIGGIDPPPPNYVYPSICTPECKVLEGGTRCESGDDSLGCIPDGDSIVAEDRWSVGTHVFKNNHEYRIRVPNGNPATEGAMRSRNLLVGVPVTDRVLVDTFDSINFFVGCECIADLNGDTAVNTVDLQMFLGKFGQTAPPCLPDAPPCSAAIAPPFVGDLNGDGAVNTFDLTLFLGRFGIACLQPPNCPPNNGLYQSPPGTDLGTTRAAIAGEPGGAATAAATQTPPGPSSPRSGSPPPRRSSPMSTPSPPKS